jgi:hypothetical protein
MPDFPLPEQDAQVARRPTAAVSKGEGALATIYRLDQGSGVCPWFETAAQKGGFLTMRALT